jgi:hypothetical protein
MELWWHGLALNGEPFSSKPIVGCCGCGCGYCCCCCCHQNKLPKVCDYLVGFLQPDSYESMMFVNSSNNVPTAASHMSWCDTITTGL